MDLCCSIELWDVDALLYSSVELYVFFTSKFIFVFILCYPAQIPFEIFEDWCGFVKRSFGICFSSSNIPLMHYPLSMIPGPRFFPNQ